MTSGIELEQVTVRVGGRLVLDDVTLAVATGETLALIGPSGSGKSTLVRLVLGLVTPRAGTVRLRDRIVSEGRTVVVPPEDRDLAVVFQDLALWPHLTVAGNLRFVLRSRRTAREEEPERVARALERVGLSGLAGRFPGELSGGERQRVAIARALVSDPDVVLFDEPMSNLDVHLVRELLALVEELLAPGDTTALWVSHDPRALSTLGRRIAVLEAGRLVQVGTRAQLFADPATPFVQAVADELTRA